MSWRLDDPSYERAAEAALPKLRAALEGKLRVPPQAESAEAALALALFYDDKAKPGTLQELEGILSMAEYVTDEIPSWAQVAEGFLRLRARGWLAQEGDRWGLTRPGREAIGAIVTASKVAAALDEVERWLGLNPAP